MRDRSLGVLIVDNPDSGAPISPASMHSLELVADQAAIVLGSTKLCVERAQRLAIEEERNRIAMEIHDTASQSLFGIVYTLDGCIKLLPNHTDQVQTRLADLRGVAERTLHDLRRSVYDIWGGELDETDFRNELYAYLRKIGAPASLEVEIQVNGAFDGLGMFTRRNILRIAEAGLANVVKHSAATSACILLDLQTDPARLVIHDNGRGMDRRARPDLASIRERARAIGGDVLIESEPGAGTRLEVRLATWLEKESDADLAGG
jgi:signal transduction histidine kinase